jgi:starch synthase
MHHHRFAHLCAGNSQPHFGMGLEGLIRSRGAQVHGIVNGIDPVEWNPATDTAIKANFPPALWQKIGQQARAGG